MNYIIKENMYRTYHFNGSYCKMIKKQHKKWVCMWIIRGGQTDGSRTGIDIVWTWGRILDSGNHIGHNFEKPDTKIYGGYTGKGGADQCT